MGFHHVLSTVAAGTCAHYKSLAVSVASILVVYCLGTFLFSLFLHPLAKFPGPKLAAWSQWWLSYQEAVKGESLTDILRSLHATYGEFEYSSLIHFSLANLEKDPL